MPQNLDPRLPADRANDAFHTEVLAEKAASLGRAGQAVARRLVLLRDAAAETTHDYLIQREPCGALAHQRVIEELEITRTVLARVGARRRGD